MPRTTRRQFLQGTAGILATATAPWFVPASAFGANERITTGHIGVGGQGRGNLSRFLALCRPVAVCDVDKNHAAQAARMVIDKTGACEVYGDYRRLLERRDLDAVVISTPDHWHALMTIHACQAGKDVYCEKPLSLTVVEGRRMVEAARRHKRIVQTGSQQRSDAKFRLGCELVRNGRIGKVHTVKVGIAASNHPGEPVPDSDPPPELDYDLWLGPAPYRPYNRKRVHYNFRFFWDYSGGQMTNWGAHHIDIAHWGLDLDDSGPLAVEGTATFHPQGWHEVTESCRITYSYADGVTMIVGQKESDCPMGTTFIGSQGTIYVNRGKLESRPTDIVLQPLGDDAVRLYASTNHHANFLDCVKSRQLPICDVEIGHRTATACHLGNIAVRTGRRIEWNPRTEQITNDGSAAEMLARPYRAPWQLDS